MAKFKAEHPDYFNTLSFPKDPRQPVAIYKDENLSKFIRDHPKVGAIITIFLSAVTVIVFL